MSRKVLIALGVLSLAGGSRGAWAQSGLPPAPPVPTVGGSTLPNAAVVGTPVQAAAPGTAVAAPVGVATTGVPVTTSVGGVLVGSPVAGASAPIVWGSPVNAQVGPIHSYSYYVEFPNPARTYVPYGPTDTFTFQGNAYGHAYDRWTWSAMSNASPGLGRYYQLLH